MMRIAAASGSATTRVETVFAAVMAGCVEFCAGARQGRDIEACYRALDRRSGPDLAKIGLTRNDIARAALTAARH